MDYPFQIYVADTETTGLNYLKHEIVELSIYHINQDRQKTWFLKPERPQDAEPDALRINGHKMQDISHQTEDGKEKYLEASKVIVDVENWMMEDMSSPEEKILAGQNISFDENFLRALWASHNNTETYPFGKRPFLLDTRQVELMINLVEGKREAFYNLGSLIKKYGVKNAKAHSAEQDTKATKLLLEAQISYLKNKMDQ